jgi:hypothetical protein
VPFVEERDFQSGDGAILVAEADRDSSARRWRASARGRKARSTVKGEPRGLPSGREVSDRAESSRRRARDGGQQHDELDLSAVR